MVRSFKRKKGSDKMARHIRSELSIEFAEASRTRK